MADLNLRDKFFYVFSCDLDVNIQIKIGTLEGQRERPSYKQLIDDPMLRFSGVCQEQCSDLYVTCQLFSDGRSLSLPVQTAYKAFTTRWNWNEWLTLPIKYSSLPRNALLAFTIWDIYGTGEAVPVGGTTVSVFGKHGTFRQGMHDLRVWADVEADGRTNLTPGKPDNQMDEMSRISKLSKSHRDGHMAKVEFLDRLTFREIEMINEKQKRESNFLYLMIEFPRITMEGTDYAIVYFEKGAENIEYYPKQREIVTVYDPDLHHENLVEAKHHRLVRSVRARPMDRELKPNALLRDRLHEIISRPQTAPLTSEEKDLIWRFRYYLSNQKKALAKFLKSVQWKLPQEEKQALEMLAKWNPMDVEDALELLSPAYPQPAVRKYAVARLKQAEDEDLLLYILQLVQALKYENFEEISGVTTVNSSLFQTRLSDSSVSGVMSIHSSASSKTYLDQIGEITDPPLQESMSDPSTLLDALADNTDETTLVTDIPEENDTDLATFLIWRACRNFKLANYFFWYLRVESTNDQEIQVKDRYVADMYRTVLSRFIRALAEGGPELQLQRSYLHTQVDLINQFVDLSKELAKDGKDRKKKSERLRALLHESWGRFNLLSFDPFPLPIDPDVTIIGIDPDSASIFKSNLMPCRYTFRTNTDETYIVIFKHGDDLRQDQLVLQIINLMDRLLRKENLDLKLTPYKVLATGSKHGFVQFIDSTAVSEILNTDGQLLNYFRRVAPCESGPFGVTPEVIDNYVKSCAGYCVITYLLGVGDRHFDNLLVTKTGKFFHIDFGFILGRDPKPLPPAMKLSKEMVDAMGGGSSQYFSDFKKHFYTAFLALRRSANLILNLFSLMVDANVPDIALEPDKTIKKVQDKFFLNLNDEEVIQHMQSLIDQSMSATVAVIVEKMHNFTQDMTVKLRHACTFGRVDEAVSGGKPPAGKVLETIATKCFYNWSECTSGVGYKSGRISSKVEKCRQGHKDYVNRVNNVLFMEMFLS